MKFDFVIGNPPYQDETIGDNKGYAPPVYHKFLENAYKIGDVVEKFYIMNRTAARCLAIRILKVVLSLHTMITQKIMEQSEYLRLMKN